jgi:hypothetical protein
VLHGFGVVVLAGGSECWIDGAVVGNLVLRRFCGIFCGGFTGVMLWVVVCVGYVEFVSLVRCDAVSFGWRGRCAAGGSVFLYVACVAVGGVAVK